MVQRLAVCRAVLHKPLVLLLDEPRANLDPGAEELVEPLVGRTAPATRVVTSHDPGTALAEADLVLGLKEGRPVFATGPEELDPDQLEALYR
jgi:ABC-type transport system involved in cytochrome bd biosynthesis fused ATPase/permease subunit